jgi:shikimate kinase
MNTRNIVLIGFKNSGKTSVGQLISEKTKKTFIDTDRLIEKNYAIQENRLLTTREIYQNKGEPYFRDLEKKIIARLDGTHNSVIATGGGSILEHDNVIHLKKQGPCIYLYASFETLRIRLATQAIPAFLDSRNEKNFHALYQHREPIYKKTADIQISTENKSMTEVCEEIILLMRDL